MFGSFIFIPVSYIVHFLVCPAEQLRLLCEWQLMKIAKVFDRISFFGGEWWPSRCSRKDQQQTHIRHTFSLSLCVVCVVCVKGKGMCIASHCSSSWPSEALLISNGGWSYRTVVSTLRLKTLLNDPLCPSFSYFLSFSHRIERERESSFRRSIIKWSSGIKVDVLWIGFKRPSFNKRPLK